MHYDISGIKQIFFFFFFVSSTLIFVKISYPPKFYSFIDKNDLFFTKFFLSVIFFSKYLFILWIFYSISFKKFLSLNPFFSFLQLFHHFNFKLNLWNWQKFYFIYPLNNQDLILSFKFFLLRHFYHLNSYFVLCIFFLFLSI